MSSVPPTQPPSSTRRYFAIGLSIIAFLFALLYWLGHGFVAAQINAGVYGGPEGLILITFVTFPPALLCTVIAGNLVGWRRCKLACISLSSFAWPYVALFIWMLWTVIASILK